MATSLGTNLPEQLTLLEIDFLLPAWIFFFFCIAPADVAEAIIKEIYAS